MVTRSFVKLSPEMLAVLEALANVDFQREAGELARARAIVESHELELRGLLPALAAMQTVHDALREAAGSIPSLDELAQVAALISTVPADALARAVEDFEARRH